MGRLVEDLEFRMRNSLQEVYFGKTAEVLSQVRSVRSFSENNKLAMLQKEMLGKLQSRRGGEES